MMDIFKISKEEIKRIGLPDTLYKYRTWKTDEDKSVLTDSQLYFAPHKSFGYNSHEFQFEYDTDLITDEILYRFYYNNSESEITSYTLRHLYALEMAKQSPFKDPEHRKRTIEEHMSLLNEIHGILSMTNSYNNERLWRDFSDNFEGYSVGIDKEFMFKNGIIDCIAGYVDYYPLANKPKLLPPFTPKGINKNIFTRIFCLPNIFSDEEEFRLSKIIRDGQRKYPIDPKLFKELIIGYKMNESNKIELKEIVLSKYPKILIIEQHLIDGKLIYKNCG